MVGVGPASSRPALVVSRTLGVDGCPGGWVAVAPDPDGLRAYAGATLADVLAAAEVDGRPDWVGVDIPIGLAEQGLRAADLAVREQLGRRAATLFLTPVRAALETDDYAGAVALNRARTGAGCSRQAYGLRAKILEVDALVRAGETRVFEVHPELSFTTMAGVPPAYGKKTWAGLQERLRLLEAHGLSLDGLNGDTGRAAADDVVDAAAVAWTARRRAIGVARSWPDPPQPLPGHPACAIWA